MYVIFSFDQSLERHYLVFILNGENVNDASNLENNMVWENIQGRMQ